VSDVILVTGFEPFGPYPANPSMDVAKALDGRRVGGAAVRSAVLPVHHAEAARRVAALLDEHAPRAVVHVGLAAGRARIALERVAVNVMDYELPDAAGHVARGEPCVPGGPAAYFSTVPLAPILAALLADGIPAYVSNTAGTYLCNQTLYTTLHRLAPARHPVAAGFVHLPLSPAMVAASGQDLPSLDVGLAARAVEIALGIIEPRRPDD
jgi:pyroglutamyl-peptidase